MSIRSRLVFAGLAGWAMVISACQASPVLPQATPSRAVVPTVTDDPTPAATPTVSPTGLQTVPVVDRLLNWSIISRSTARPSSHFDFDGQSLAYWTYQSTTDRGALALSVENSGEARQVYRVPGEPPWQVGPVELDGAHAAWLEIGWGDDPRVYRLWVFDLAGDVSHLITETQPSPQPDVPTLALDGNWLVVRALGADGNTCLYSYDLSTDAGREPLCSSDLEILYGDPYLRGSILTYSVEDRRQGCSFIQQIDLTSGHTTSLQTLSCLVGLRVAADASLLVWPEKVLLPETGEIAEVRLRGRDTRGDVLDLGGARTSYYQVCDGRAYWLSFTSREAAETGEVRAWAPGEPIEVLYRAAPAEHILGLVCAGDQIAFIDPVRGQILGARYNRSTPTSVSFATPFQVVLAVE